MPGIMRRGLITSLFSAAIALAVVGQAGECRAEGITVSHVWARSSAGPAKNGAAYLTIGNDGAKADRLVNVETRVAVKASLHAHTLENGIMAMRPIKAVEVGPGDPVVLKPGGTHIMLMGLAAPLKEGQTFPMTLSFENSGPIDVQVMVHGPSAMAPDHQGHQMKH